MPSPVLGEAKEVAPRLVAVPPRSVRDERIAAKNEPPCDTVDMATSEEWSRIHSHGWIGWVVPAPEWMGHRYLASVALAGNTRGASDHATVELAKAASDETVQNEDEHTCSAECGPWRRGVDGDRS